MFEYPRLENASALANKSFFKADKVDMFWNKKGIINSCIGTYIFMHHIKFKGLKSLGFEGLEKITDCCMTKDWLF